MPQWVSGQWFLRPESLFLIPGDSPMGYRLPLDSLPWVSQSEYPPIHEPDPFGARSPLPERPDRTGTAVRARTSDLRGARSALRRASQWIEQRKWPGILNLKRLQYPSWVSRPHGLFAPHSVSSPETGACMCSCHRPKLWRTTSISLPPSRTLQPNCRMPVVIEGYLPPPDTRLKQLKVTPDPGVIEVNVHPASSWKELVETTEILYDEARQTRLGTEKFMLDGRHVGTGGGNHVVIGGATPADSLILRRPDVLRSLLSYWHNHPSLSYLFAGLFIGPTSQHPRIDEARNDAVYEIEIAFQQLAKEAGCPPWHVDRVLRNLLADVTGNTHRSEFCIDKLFPPENSSSRLGLVELRSFEMPPHPE